MSEDREIRLRRLWFRSWRRGIREMDLILGPFADTALAELDGAGLDAYERLLEEPDWDLYDWVAGKVAPPAEHATLIRRIASFHNIGRG